MAELLGQVQQDFGEGPGVVAYTQGEPVAVTDLGSATTATRIHKLG